MVVYRSASSLPMAKMFFKKTPEQRRSMLIDRQLLADHKKNSAQHSILLLGTGESGKTTILKQIKIIHCNQYCTNEEKQEHIRDIRNNIHESIYTIVSNLSLLRPSVVVNDKEAQRAVKYILNKGAVPPAEYSQEYYDNVALLWRDADIQEMYKRGNEYHLLDSTGEFMARLDEIRSPDYLPTTQDILYCRVMTTSISKVEFEVDAPKHYWGEKARFVMHDVGGQRGHRKKWIKVFQDIKTLLYVISASDFDQVLREEESMNRLEEAMTLFENMFNSRYLQTNNAIVFLNKVDILEEKVRSGTSIGTYFAKYKLFKKARDEFENTKLFIKEEVETIIKTGSNKRNTYIHFTVATSTDNIKRIFDSVHSMIIEEALNDVVPY